MRNLVKRKLIFILGLTLAAALLQSTPANAQINLASIGFYPSVIAGSQYEIELGLTAPQNIRVTSYLQGPKKERVSGLAKLKSGSLKNGKWALIFNVRENTRAGNYKIYIKATAGRSVWIDQDRFVVVQKKPQVDNQQASSDNRGSNPNSNTNSVYDAASSDHLESLPSFVYGLGKSCDTSSGKCPALTPEASLEGQNECKIKDVTYPNDSSLYVSSAFTTPPYSLAGRSKIDLSWLPVSFKDRPMPQQLYQSAVKTAKEAEGFYEFNSYGRVDFNFTVPDKDNWIALPETVNFYENLWASMTSQQVAQYYKLKLFPYSSFSADTPSYPSGHTLQAYVILNVIADKYPNEYQFCKEMINDIAYSRIYLGLHFATDNDFAKFVGQEILKNPNFTKKYEI
jgi:hypothetical protein